ncbi:MAG: class I SAM-dependent methyltransferase [Chromatiales bacterium]|jgi:spermidine synthase
MKHAVRSLGDLLYQTRDEIGPISVYQRKSRRFLTFGNGVEQSCCDLEHPARLEHVYTQAMMLALLLQPDTSSALLLGLGGGSLARALRAVRLQLQIHAVEYRQAVIDVARDFFALHDDRYLQLHCDDAQHYVNSDARQYDLLFADLYLADSVHQAQQDAGFLSACRQRLSDHGVLLMNSWSSEFRDSVKAQRALQQAFGEQVIFFHVQGGNVIAFAFNGSMPDLRRNDFFGQAQQLGLRLGIPLQKLARNFWRQNSEPLQLGRFSIKRRHSAVPG